MCQTDNKLVKLRKDRVAYKVEKYYAERWRTPYFDSVLERNKTITAFGKSDIEQLGAGYFHCTCNKKFAIIEAIKWKHAENVRIVKTIIPAKNNTVYKGIDEWDRPSICARKIILTDEVVWEA